MKLKDVLFESDISKLQTKKSITREESPQIEKKASVVNLNIDPNNQKNLIYMVGN